MSSIWSVIKSYVCKPTDIDETVVQQVTSVTTSPAPVTPSVSPDVDTLANAAEECARVTQTCGESGLTPTVLLLTAAAYTGCYVICMVAVQYGLPPEAVDLCIIAGMSAYVWYMQKPVVKGSNAKVDVTQSPAEAPKGSVGKSDVASSWDMNFQTPATDIMEKIVDLHHDLMFFLVVIVLFVSWVLARLISSYQSTNSVTPRVAFAHHTLLEKIWTYIPAGILVLIASPSFSLLYSIDALTEPQISVKVIGHQWYWSYETTDLVSAKDINFDSYMALEADLPAGGLRLLEVDNRLALPIRTNIRLIITAADVLHSWALPALGVKMDACPGRLNQVSLHLNRSGVFYGQCSELCGINHSFMPIVVDAVTREQYRQWLNSQD